MTLTRNRILSALLFALLCLSLSSSTTPANAAPPQNQLILDTFSQWRMFHVLKPPAVESPAGPKPFLQSISWLDKDTDPVPAKWNDPEFDDSNWATGTALRSCVSPYLDRLCLRTRFQVTDPAQVKSLAISLTYTGGAIVFLNGKEVGRGNVAAANAAYADSYPLEAFVDEAGNLLAAEGTYTGEGQRAGKPSADSVQRMAARVRSLKDLPIPSNLLQKGVNTLAVEIIRAPYNKVVGEKDKEAGKKRYNHFDWPTCEIKSIQLTAPSPQGIVPNAQRPQSLQIWNTNPLASDTDLDWGNPADELAPINLVGPRNGLFSGKVGIGSSNALKGLRATAGDLKGEAGTIPAANVLVRYGIPGGDEVGTTRGADAYRTPYGEGANLLGLVARNPLPEYPLRKASSGRRAGSVATVWVTVKIPKDAKPGSYLGTVNIEAQGQPSTPVKVRLRVVDYTLPDPQDYRTWVDLVEVPDTLAVEYDLPMWSDKHFALIGRAFDEMSDSGSRTVYIPAIAHTDLGNSESMIRWIKKGEGKYDWDFSVMDKYLDLAMKHLGTPKIVCLQVWEIYMSTRESAGSRLAEFGIGSAPQITLLDPATGKTELGKAPQLKDPASKAIWTSLLQQVKEHLHKRNLDKTLMLGMFTDAVPTKDDVQFFKTIAPDLTWVQQGHGLYEKNDKVQGIGVLGYQATVWGSKFSDGVLTHGTVLTKRAQGWKRDILVADFERNTSEDSFPTTRWRLFGETNITGMQRGMGRIGADYWRAVKDKRGRSAGWVHNRYPEGAWGAGGSMNLNLCNPVLGPGPEGPEASQRLLMMDEGVEECEARTLIERALDDPAQKGRLGADLAKRCEDLLDNRDMCMWKGVSNELLGGNVWGATAWRWEPGVAGNVWFIGSGWQDRSQKLFTLAGEVAHKTGLK